MSLSFRVVIPARYASSRFPGKPLVEIAGKTMLQHVYDCALKSGAQQVIIATDDERIQQAAEGFGATVCMTSPEHPSGTDRLAEVSLKYDWAIDDIVVNLQGDEPLTPPELLKQVALNLADHPRAGIATLSTAIQSARDVFDPNVVKVVADAEGYALYFSRAPIPWNRDTGEAIDDAQAQQYQRHLGIYAYRVSFLHAYTNMEPCVVENLEKLEQLRALYSGIPIHVEPAVSLPGPGIDTPDDLVAVSRLMTNQ
ncbi:MAG: 3-deoxy-manno-octulosonate cytidylyltransferase [Gammaproteobacteria bacterium]|nr:3-deoxy-manno-octulosonate cytidylyltransferase [Gammaproteobacteria bacterium]